MVTKTFNDGARKIKINVEQVPEIAHISVTIPLQKQGTDTPKYVVVIIRQDDMEFKLTSSDKELGCTLKRNALVEKIQNIKSIDERGISNSIQEKTLDFADPRFIDHAARVYIDILNLCQKQNIQIPISLDPEIKQTQPPKPKKRRSGRQKSK